MKTLILSLFLGLACNLLTVAQVKKSPPKSWIQPVGFEKDARPKQGQESGFYYLLIDEQKNFPAQESFFHYAYRIESMDGLQTMSDISLEYDPSYEEITLHSLAIYRGQDRITQMSNPIREMEREQSMDQQMYDGRKTAHINLTDVRVGDIIEYSFTRKGENPVFGTHYSDRIYLNYTIPIEKKFHRYLFPLGHEPHILYFNTSKKPLVSSDSKYAIYIWQTEKTEGLITDNYTPDWYDPYAHIIISDFKSWNEVATWATPLYRVNERDKKIIADKISSIITGDTPERFAINAIRFVQDDIRYLGFEFGLNSHKPHSPVKVLDQRFGDCKDKSLLLCSILNSRGIESYPVLVSTQWRDKLGDIAPSFHAFNHCVVQILFPEDTVYVDPTISYQGGSVENINFPAYGKGLVIADASTGLTILPKPHNSSISEEQTFDLYSIGGEAIVTIRSTYLGQDADFQRSEFSRKTLDQIQKNYQEYYGNLYPDISVHEPLTYQDNREGNIFTVTEKYLIPSLWKPLEGDENIITCQFYPQVLESYFTHSKSSTRTGPYRLAFPADIHHYINIRLPEEWNVIPEEKIIDRDSYLYEYSVRAKDQEINLYRHYTTKRDHIPVENFSRFVSDHEDMMNHLTYQLTYNKTLAESDSPVAGIGVLVASLIFGVWLVIWLYHRYDPEPAYPTPGSPIGGWLILVAIGITLTPFRILYDFFQQPDLILGDIWYRFLTVKQYGVTLIMMLLQVYNCLFLFFSCVLVLLFFQRRSSVPRLASIFYGVACLMSLVDSYVAMQFDPSGESGKIDKSVYQSILAAAIWIPYFNLSSRVKETFVNRSPDKNDELPEPSTISTGSMEEIIK